MAEPRSRERVALGFQPAARCSPAPVRRRRWRTCAARCRRAETGWKEIEAVDGSVLVNLAQVLYLRVESDEHAIGF